MSFWNEGSMMHDDYDPRPGNVRPTRFGARRSAHWYVAAFFYMQAVSPALRDVPEATAWFAANAR